VGDDSADTDHAHRRATNTVVKQWEGAGGDSLRVAFGSVWLSNLREQNVWRIDLKGCSGPLSLPHRDRDSILARVRPDRQNDRHCGSNGRVGGTTAFTW